MDINTNKKKILSVIKKMNIIFLIFSFVTLCLILTNLLKSNFENNKLSINQIIKEYNNDIDISFMCKVTNCDFVYLEYDNSLNTFNDLQTNFTKSESIIIDIVLTEYKFFFDLSSFKIGVIISEADYGFAYFLPQSLMTHILIIFSGTVLNLGIIFLFSRKLIKEVLFLERRQSFINDLETSKRNLLLISESINHEIRTPLSSLFSSIKIIEKEFKKMESKRKKLEQTMIENEKINIFHLKQLNMINETVNEIFVGIDLSIKKIFSILDELSEDNNIQTDDLYCLLKNINTIIIFSKYNSKFFIEVSDVLKNYILNTDLIPKETVLSVFMTLIQNSLKFGSSFINISLIKDYEKSKKINILFKNNGKTMSDSEIKEIFSFDCFKIVERSFGLFYSREILKPHGDLVFLLSDKNGTKFSVLLPYLKSSNQLDQLDQLDQVTK